MFKATDIREWRGHDIVVAEGHKVGELPAGDEEEEEEEEEIFRHYGLTYQAGADGERRRARR